MTVRMLKVTFGRQCMSQVVFSRKGGSQGITVSVFRSFVSNKTHILAGVAAGCASTWQS